MRNGFLVEVEMEDFGGIVEVISFSKICDKIYLLLISSYVFINKT